MIGMRLVLLSLVIVTIGAMPADARGPQSAGSLDRQQSQLQRDLTAMERRLGESQLPAAAVVADAQRLSAGFRGLEPFVPSIGSSNLRHRQLAQRSFDWLNRASVRFRRDRTALHALFGTYRTLGDFHRVHPIGFQRGAWLGYLGASRLARGFVLDGGDDALYERELERMVLEWATYAYVSQYLYGPPAVMPASAGSVGQSDLPQDALAPVPMPAIDESTLDEQQRAAWPDVRERFLTVSIRVNEARTFLAQLTARLHARGMTLNLEDTATALKMQGYVEDAAGYIRDHLFDKATAALIKADYERHKLRNTTGQ